MILTYSFSTAPTAYLQSTDAAAAATFHVLTDDEKNTVRAALAQWSAVSGITFIETTATTGDLAFGFYDLSTISGSDGEAGLGNYPSTGTYVDSSGVPQVYSNFLSQGGDVYFDNSYQTNSAYFSDFAHIAIHEIGHALGLKHPFDSNSTGPSYTLDPSLDNGSETVMAYAGVRSATLGPLDVQAIQYLYGTNTGAAHPFTETWNAATESLTVTGSSTQAQTLYGSGGNDVFYSLGQHDALSGGEGNDLFYLVGKPAAVNGGSGTDTVVTGLAYSGLTTQVSGTGSAFRYVYLPVYSDFQTYVNVAYLDFTNGVYTTASNGFVSFDSVASPGTTNSDSYSWRAGSSDWGNAANWVDASAGSTVLPPGAADAVTLAGGAAGTPTSISGVGNAASFTETSLYGALAGVFGFGALSVVAGGLTVAAGAAVTVSGLAQVGLAALGVGGAMQVAGLTLGGGSVSVTGTLEVGMAGGAQAGAVTVDAGRSLSGTGVVSGAVVNNGVVVASGGTLSLSGGVSGAGSLQVGAGGTLVLGSLTEAVAFSGAGGSLSLVNPAGGASGVVSGFVAGDTIVVSSAAGAATGVSYVSTGSNLGTLTLSRGSTVVASLQLAGRYSGSQFALAGTSATAATVTVGAAAVSDPLFDAAYYLAHNPDVAAAGVDPYQHYMTQGWKEGRNPSALFDTRYYLTQNPDVKAAGVNPLTHFETFGWVEGRNPDAWFDTRYYLAQNPDVAAAHVDPLVHFLQYGWLEGRQPSLVFDDAKYLTAYQDVKAAGVDPLAHYLANGQAEGRMSFLTGGSAAADPLVNAGYYDAQLGATLIPAGAAGAQQAAYAYDHGGWQAGLNPDAWFNTAYYLSHNPDVAAAHVDSLLHYETYGWKEGRDPSASFSTSKYLAAYGDVAAAGVDPLLHYVAYGQAEGRTAFAV